MNRHQIFRPDWLSAEAWSQIEPMLEAMPADGGCIAIVIDAQPDVRNFVTGSVTSFTGKQRQALRKAILKARKAKQEPKQ